MRRTTQGDLFAFACALSTGLGIIPAKAAIESIAADTLTFYLFLFAFGYTLFFLIRKDQRVQVAMARKKQIRVIVLLAFLFTISIYLSWSALKHLEPATQSFLSRFKIFVTVGFAFFILRERLGISEIIGGLVAVGGVFLLKFKAGPSVSTGATLMIIAAFISAAAEVLLKSQIAQIHPTTFLFYRNLFMLPFLALIILFNGSSFTLPDAKTALLVGLTALLMPMIGRTTYIMAIKRNKLSRTVLINQTQPLFAGAAAFILLGSFPSIVEWIGGALILAGALIIRLGTIRPRPATP
jgi:drug/metabolite transporter (DMT)-like permease